MCELRCALKRPWCPRLPAWLVRLGAFLMRTEPGLALTGRRALPERLVEQHFKFLYTNLESALADLTAEGKSKKAKGKSEDAAGKLIQSSARVSASTLLPFAFLLLPYCLTHGAPCV
jgi:hypothetical protein